MLCIRKCHVMNKLTTFHVTVMWCGACCRRWSLQWRMCRCAEATSCTQAPSRALYGWETPWSCLWTRWVLNTTWHCFFAWVVGKSNWHVQLFGSRYHFLYL